MKLKSEKGITGIDITLSVILISIFIGILATMSYNIQNNAKQADRHATALNYAISSIEEMKSLDFSALPKVGSNKIDGYEDGYLKDSSGKDTPYYRTITVLDYTELDGKSDAKPEKVKKVTVNVSYRFQSKTQNITLSVIRAEDETKDV